MNEEEDISEFHPRLCNIVNTSFSLVEKMYEEKLARKFLGSFPKKFDIKVTTIEEARDLRNIKDDELIGSCRDAKNNRAYRTLEI